LAISKRKGRVMAFINIPFFWAGRLGDVKMKRIEFVSWDLLKLETTLMHFW
jgi:hypothetical protein